MKSLIEWYRREYKECDESQAYIDYVEEHIKNVQKSWSIIKEKCADTPIVTDGSIHYWININILRHDKSKLSEHEFEQYRQWFYPKPGEKKDEELFKRALHHHVSSNGHHHENVHRFIVKEKFMIYATEMLCDWMAMGMKFGDTAEEYYHSNSHKMMLSKYQDKKDFLFMIFDKLKR